MSYAQEDWLVNDGQIEEGDRVCGPNSTPVYIVIAIHEQAAWVKREDTGASSIADKRRLRRAVR